jgi:hypothetical protein
MRRGDLRHRSTGQQIAAVIVGDRQRVAANAVPGAIKRFGQPWLTPTKR